MHNVGSTWRDACESVWRNACDSTWRDALSDWSWFLTNEITGWRLVSELRSELVVKGTLDWWLIHWLLKSWLEYCVESFSFSNTWCLCDHCFRIIGKCLSEAAGKTTLKILHYWLLWNLLDCAIDLNSFSKSSWWCNNSSNILKSITNEFC